MPTSGHCVIEISNEVESCNDFKDLKHDLDAVSAMLSEELFANHIRLELLPDYDDENATSQFVMEVQSPLPRREFREKLTEFFKKVESQFGRRIYNSLAVLQV